jgi:hypothetical protein
MQVQEVECSVIVKLALLMVIVLLTIVLEELVCHVIMELNLDKACSVMANLVLWIMIVNQILALINNVLLAIIIT